MSRTTYQKAVKLGSNKKQGKNMNFYMKVLIYLLQQTYLKLLKTILLFLCQVIKKKYKFYYIFLPTFVL